MISRITVFRRGVMALLAALALGLGHGAAQAQMKAPNPYSDIRIDQKLGDQIPLDLEFTDEDGKAVRLRDYFGAKPVVLTLVYYECPMLCTEVLRSSLDAFNALSFGMGNEYTVLTVSINPNDTAELAAAKKKTHLDNYKRGGGADGWHFLTGKQDAISALADSVGFHYVYDEATKQYAHASGIMVITPSGKVSRYLMGIDYYAGTLKLALLEAGEGKIGTVAEKLSLLCYHYDPVTGKYGVYIMGVLRLIGAGMVMVLATLVLMTIIRSRRQRPPMDFAGVVPLGRQ
ncbi:MAG: SCO family protein [Candidatus Hydrogenedentes bacterium]|nr:SCO family protein [Candidatus Hydrogenedentota bacterium]